MQDILSAMNEFIDDSIVLPAGNWDKDLLLPVLRLQNKKMKERQLREDVIMEEDEEEEEPLLTEEDGGKHPGARGTQRFFFFFCARGKWDVPHQAKDQSITPLPDTCSLFFDQSLFPPATEISP